MSSSSVGATSASAGVLTADEHTLSLYHFDNITANKADPTGKVGIIKDAGPHGMNLYLFSFPSATTKDGKFGGAVQLDKESRINSTTAKGDWTKV